ncbi:tetratricopeptide repeat protein [Actinorugispora endophytica]|uniref:Tetratricopeptide repeat protein n=1 Tax=Actinorugispora endophytica TaxID=1605990 RepID=A0A4R6V1K0_9ACTN|nr:tetratricopeptide repeat protein [Actinorugispora endophytica]TDQ53734.1 tetratricopeptide repeat protein [Actinorugispora endophytica]
MSGPVAGERRNRQVRVRALFDMGRYEQCEQEALRILASEPDDQWALLMLSRTRNRRGDGGGSMEAAERLLALHPGFPAGLAWYAALVADVEGHYSRALSYARHAVRLSPDGEFELCVLAVVAVELRGCADEARTAARRALRIAPDDPACHEALRRVHGVLGEWEQALEPARAAAALRPGDAGHWFRLGEVLMYLGRHTEAEEAFLATLRQRPLPGQLTRMVGVLLGAGAPEPLRGLLTRVCAALGRPDPTVPHAAGTDPGLVRWQLDAVADLGASDLVPPIVAALYEDNPGHPGVRARQAEALLERGECEQAWETAGGLVCEGRADADGYAVAALALHDLERHEEAAGIAREGARRFEGGDWNFHYVEALALSALRDHDGVLEATARALEEHPAHPDTLVLRGSTQLLRDAREAVPTLRAAVAADPESGEARIWLAKGLELTGAAGEAAAEHAEGERLLGRPVPR